MANVRALLDNDRPSEAISLLEDAVGRAAHDRALELRLRHLLGAALFYAGEYTRAASLFDVVGRDYRKHLPAKRLLRARLRLPRRPCLCRDREAGQGPAATAVLRAER